MLVMLMILVMLVMLMLMLGWWQCNDINSLVILLIIDAQTPSDGPAKNGRGNFVLLDGKTFKPKASWPASEQVND